MTVIKKVIRRIVVDSNTMTVPPSGKRGKRISTFRIFIKTCLQSDVTVRYIFLGSQSALYYPGKSVFNIINLQLLLSIRTINNKL